MKEILNYLKTEYDPLAIVTYGSFENGTNDEYSDFDCMVIVREKSRSHDDAVIGGIRLDCYIFTEEEAAGADPEPFLTLYDGRIVTDTGGIAEKLQKRVRSFVAENSVISEDEKELITGWIGKTLHRMEKNDDEGNYRAMALLWESLTDYFLLRDMFYFGSKKAAAWLKEKDPDGYLLYHEAVTERSNEAIRKWAEYLAKIK